MVPDRNLKIVVVDADIAQSIVTAAEMLE